MDRKGIFKGRIFSLCLVTAFGFEAWMLLGLTRQSEDDPWQQPVSLPHHQPGKLRVGDKLPSLKNLRHLRGKTKKVNMGTNGAILIFTNDCTGCSAPWLHDVQSWQKDENALPCYVVLRTAEEMKEPPPKILSRLCFFLDIDGSACQAMDVHFLPRLYGVGPDGKVRYIQPFGVSILDALERARQLTESGR